jgi:hypothetical protein
LLICVFACVFAIDVLLCKPSFKPDRRYLFKTSGRSSIAVTANNSQPSRRFSDVRSSEFEDFRGEEEIDG